MTRILLVEDDHDVRLLVEHVLLDAGYEVDTTDSVSGGLSLLECRSYDLVLADGRLGDGTGMQVADRARELRDTPVLIVTGYAFDLPRSDLVRYDYLLKPVRPRELVAAVQRVLGEPWSVRPLARRQSS
jgi:DNA-binding response OmpR family regulator